MVVPMQTSPCSSCDEREGQLELCPRCPPHPLRPRRWPQWGRRRRQVGWKDIHLLRRRRPAPVPELGDGQGEEGEDEQALPDEWSSAAELLNWA